MEIFILSSGRPFRQTTFQNLPKGLQDRTRIVVPSDEVNSYRNYPTLTSEHVVRNPGKVRQWLVSQSEIDQICMLDDDLIFTTRREDNPTLFRNPTDAEVYQLFDDIEQSLVDYSHVGVATREGGNRNAEQHLFNQRMMRVLAYDCRTLRKHQIRFDRLQVMEDFDVTLQLLSKGFPNVILNNMVQNQNGSNLAGGCSQWRTEEIQADGARGLAAFWPEYVRVVQKRTKTAWDGKPRVDVVVQWKKCYYDSPNFA